ncbi:NAD(P)H-dependent oxidoreductase [Alphaproteobacteria bacterium LSUCC0684]
MFLFTELMARIEAGGSVRVALVGAGKFGSMFLAQVPTTPGLQVVIIADLDPEKARQSCRDVGWDEDRIAWTRFVEDGLAAITPEVDVIIEATGHPHAGIRHARAAIREGVHIIMVNVEADVLAGASLAAEARATGCVYSMAYGDQPALTAEMVEWARACGFRVMAAGKGTKYLPAYHASTPDSVWDHYGLSAEEAAEAGMNSKMFNSFLDGTKSALEMAAIANACDLMPPSDGLAFPPCGMDDLAQVLRPAEKGGVLEAEGMVEAVSSLNRDGSDVERDLRWGVYVVLEAPNDYAAACFRQYGMNTDTTGQFSAMYKPFHLIGLELNISVLAAGLLGRATGSTRYFRSDVVATAKRAMPTGTRLDGEGGHSVWGKLIPAERSLSLGGLPIGLAGDVNLIRQVKAGQMLTWDDIAWDEGDEIIRYRRAMEQTGAS